MALRGMQALQQWAKVRTQGYQDVDVKDMSKSWRDGLAFCALIHKYRPDLMDFDSLSKTDVYENNKSAFEVAEHELGIPALLEARDMVALKVPDRLSIATYVAQYYNYFKEFTPAGGPGVNVPRKQPIKRQTPPSSPTPQAKKFLFEEKDTKSSSKQNTISDRCALCKDKVYLLERHLVDGKSYHRSCFRRQNPVSPNKPYTSVLQSPIKKTKELRKVVKDAQVHGPPNEGPNVKHGPPNEGPNVKSPTVEARSDFFSAETEEVKTTDQKWHKKRTEGKVSLNSIPRPHSPPRLTASKPSKVPKTDPVSTRGGKGFDTGLDLKKKLFANDKTRASNATANEELSYVEKGLAEIRKRRQERELARNTERGVQSVNEVSKRNGEVDTNLKRNRANEKNKPKSAKERLAELEEKRKLLQAKTIENDKDLAACSSKPSPLLMKRSSRIQNNNNGMKEAPPANTTVTASTVEISCVTGPSKGEDIKVSPVKEVPNSENELEDVPKAPPRRKRSTEEKSDDVNIDSFSYGFGLAALRRKKKPERQEEHGEPTPMSTELIEEEQNLINDGSVAVNGAPGMAERIQENVVNKKFDESFEYDPSERKFKRKDEKAAGIKTLFRQKFGSAEDLTNLKDDDDFKKPIGPAIKRVQIVNAGMSEGDSLDKLVDCNKFSSSSAEDLAKKRSKIDKIKQKRAEHLKSSSVDNIAYAKFDDKAKQNVCNICGDKVFRLERKLVDDVLYHKNCLKKREKAEARSKSPIGSPNRVKENIDFGKDVYGEADKPKKEHRFKKKKSPTKAAKDEVALTSASRSKSVEDLAPENVNTKQKMGKLKKLFKSPKKSNRPVSMSAVTLESETSVCNHEPRPRLLSQPELPENGEEGVKINMQALRQKFGDTPRIEDQTDGRAKVKSETDVRFANDDDYKKLEVIKTKLFKPEETRGQRHAKSEEITPISGRERQQKIDKIRSESDQNPVNEPRDDKGVFKIPNSTPIRMKTDAKPSTCVLTKESLAKNDNTPRKKHEIPGDTRPAWQIEAERRAALRSGSYADPEEERKKKLIAPKSDEELVTDTPERMARYRKIVPNKDMKIEFESSIDESVIVSPSSGKMKSGATPRTFRPLSASSPADDLTPKRHYAPMAPAIKRKVGGERRLSAEEIKQQLDDLDKKQTELEEKGRDLENSLRKSTDGDDDKLLVKWFELVNEKNKMVRRESEIMYIGSAGSHDKSGSSCGDDLDEYDDDVFLDDKQSRAQQLEDQQADLEYELRKLLATPEYMKKVADKKREEQLLDEIVATVEERNKIVESLDEDRIREAEEDKGIEEALSVTSLTDNKQTKKAKKGKKK